MELIHPIFKWLHVIAGIMWIGLLYFFNFVNTAFAPTMDAETKKKVVPELMPRTLYWFRWGAAWNIDDLALWEGTAEDAMNHYIDERRSQGRRPFIDAPHFELVG